MQMEMQQAQDVERNPIKPKASLDLTDRDYGIIELANEMKFVSITEVYEKFFATLRNNEPAKNDLWAQKRLSELEKFDLLKKTKSFAESKSYYQATKKGRRLLGERYPDRLFANYYSGFDLNTFHHDKMVLSSRMYLEKNGVAINWQSDRNLRQEPAITKSGLRPYVPDGIYETATGRKVALEVEIAQKGKNKYQEKIQKFIEHLRQPVKEERLFNVVHFVCEKQRVFEIISEETAIYGNSFFVTRSEEFFNGKYEV